MSLYDNAFKTKADINAARAVLRGALANMGIEMPETATLAGLAAAFNNATGGTITVNQKPLDKNRNIEITAADIKAALSLSETPSDALPGDGTPEGTASITEPTETILQKLFNFCKSLKSKLASVVLKVNNITPDASGNVTVTPDEINVAVVVADYDNTELPGDNTEHYRGTLSSFLQWCQLNIAWIKCLTVRSVNNVTPDANGNVKITIPAAPTDTTMNVTLTNAPNSWVLPPLSGTLRATLQGFRNLFKELALLTMQSWEPRDESYFRDGNVIEYNQIYSLNSEIIISFNEDYNEEGALDVSFQVYSGVSRRVFLTFEKNTTGITREVNINVNNNEFTTGEINYLVEDGEMLVVEITLVMSQTLAVVKKLYSGTGQ